MLVDVACPQKCERLGYIRGTFVHACRTSAGQGSQSSQSKAKQNDMGGKTWFIRECTCMLPLYAGGCRESDVASNGEDERRHQGDITRQTNVTEHGGEHAEQNTAEGTGCTTRARGQIRQNTGRTGPTLALDDQGILLLPLAAPPHERRHRAAPSLPPGTLLLPQVRQEVHAAAVFFFPVLSAPLSCCALLCISG